jgi:NitT/TauT family transport system substrate-binding protein
MFRFGQIIRCAVAATAIALMATSTPLFAQEKVKIGLAVPNYGPLAAVYVAEELGYYKQFGVQAEITAYRGGAAAQQALAAGEADLIDFFPPGVALAVKKGVKQKVVAAGSVAADGWHLVVLKDSPIKSVKDLAGRKVGVTAKGSTTDFFALWAAKKGGGEIQTVPVGAGGLIPALKGKQVDAVSMHSPLPLQLIASGEGRSIADYGKEIGPSLPDVWVASQAIIDQRPKALEGALRAIFKATRYLKENRAYALKYLKTFTQEADNKVIELEYESAIMGRSTDAAMRPEWLRAAMKLAEGSGLDFAGIDEIYTDKFAHVKE